MSVYTCVTVWRQQQKLAASRGIVEVPVKVEVRWVSE